VKSLLIILVLLPFGAWANCGNPEKILIGSEARCFEAGGVDIGYLSEEGIKVACMQDQRVRSVCGPDGQVTRLQAYRQWFSKLKEAEAACAASGGDLAFEDPLFSEPTNETFCAQAQPVVGSNMFEGALCNYTAACPTVTVVCEKSCKSDRHAASYEPPPIAFPVEDESFLKRLAKRR